MQGKSSSPSAEGAVQKVRFGNFEVINDPDGHPLLLGKGTFGRTYQARHCFLDTIVALKIITERYASDAAVRRRFLTEARAVAKLSHPHIARLYDFGEMNGVLHYAMEYCGGGSLADYVATKGPLPLRQTIEIAEQISGALKCAHTAGFIHRDLKPSNILLTAPDSPLFTKLIDFGLVQPILPGATGSFGGYQSADGARFLGTPLFASPEQLREEPTDVRTDLFSLGMTLWFLMAGRAPDSGSSAEIAASRLNRESYAARLPANLPPPFRNVLAQLLEKDRKNRFSTATDVFNALNACAAALGFRRERDYTDLSEQLSTSMKMKPISVFLCHSSGDKPTVRSLYSRLRSDGISPWLDEEDLRPGENWQTAIGKAVRNADVVLVCLSKTSIAKTGFVQKEIAFALDRAEEQPEGQIYLIPVRLEPCAVPERLSQWHWVDLFADRGYEKLVGSLSLIRGHDASSFEWDTR